jgi:hypothetical protein
MQLSWLKLGVKLGPVFDGHPENAIVSSEREVQCGHGSTGSGGLQPPAPNADQ